MKESRWRLLNGLGTLCTVIVAVLITAPACSSSTDEDAAGEAESETADLNESIVGGEWLGTEEDGDAVTLEFFADGTLSAGERGTRDNGTYRFVDEDTITSRLPRKDGGGESSEEQADISLPTEDTLSFTPLNKDGNPAGEAIVFRKDPSKELVQQQVGDFELQAEGVDPPIPDQIFEAQTGERVLRYKAPDGSTVLHMLLVMPTPEDAERKRQEWLASTRKEPKRVVKDFTTQEEPRMINGRQVGTAVLFRITPKRSQDDVGTGAVWTNGTLVAFVMADREDGTNFYRSLSEYY